MDSYFAISAKATPTIQLQALITDGTLVYYAYKAHENADWITAAKALYLIAKAQTTTPVALSTTSHPVFGSLTEALSWHNAVLSEAELDNEALSSLTKLVTAGRRLGIWMTAIKRDGPGGLAESLVTKAIDSADVGVINISTLRDTFQALEEIIGSDRLTQQVHDRRYRHRCGPSGYFRHRFCHAGTSQRTGPAVIFATGGVAGLEVVGGEKAFLLQKPHSQEDLSAVLKRFLG